MRSWWNSLVSSNRHADSSRSPYNPSFTSIRTGHNSESVSSLTKNTAYGSYDVSSNASTSQVNLTSPDTSQFPSRPNSSGVPMQDFQHGVAPPPPVSDSWRRIDKWTEDNYPELYDQLSYGATEADVDELEHLLDMSLPGDVRESFFIHDGQERGGRPTGLFFGIALLDCEELVDEYNLWKKVAASLPRPSDYPQSHLALGPSQQSRRPAPERNTTNLNKRPRPAQAKQSSRPEGAVQSVYAHPGWIPMAKDYMGNNIAIDLAPGSRGRVGQVILFGRDCDVKFVVAPSWSAFLASFVNDLESEHVVVDEDVGVGGEMGQLRYIVDLERPEQQFSYLDILKARIRRRDRALRGPHTEEAPSHTSMSGAGEMKRNGKGRASSPLKHVSNSTESAGDRSPEGSGSRSTVHVPVLDSNRLETAVESHATEPAIIATQDAEQKAADEATVVQVELTDVNLQDEADPSEIPSESLQTELET